MPFSTKSASCHKPINQGGLLVGVLCRRVERRQHYHRRLLAFILKFQTKQTSQSSLPAFIDNWSGMKGFGSFLLLSDLSFFNFSFRNYASDKIKEYKSTSMKFNTILYYLRGIYLYMSTRKHQNHNTKDHIIAYVSPYYYLF